ncbi:hypothetical protein K1719_040912 [Acacia pycnantha]|nr:hypothetical protein K1719_040912 [Acacia pycnantha]
MMPADSLSVPSTVHTLVDPNSNPNPNSNPLKKRRNLPGTPDPDAEVIALSPKSLMATNRFICEICKKGFQRDQNLQLHRRGHNLPWKLRQRTNKEEVRKKVYVCPEKTCVHHDPSRALGDLTGIKKHFSRKHGEKKWKCDKCSKKYAVQSDWKAHSKICGTREYKCDCGTIFSRKDSFITHRAFCDALGEESARTITRVPSAFNNLMRSDHLMMSMNQQTPRISPEIFPGFHSEFAGGSEGALGNFGQLVNNHHLSVGSNNNLNSLVQGVDMFATSTHETQWVNRYPSEAEASITSANNMCVSGKVPHGLKQEPEENNKAELSHSIGALYSPSCLQIQNPQAGGGANHMSATALLHKAAQIGSSTTNNVVNHFGSAVLNSSNNNVTNLDLHKIFNQTNNKSTNLGGGFLLNDSFASTTKELGLTRDFLGVGGESMSGPFLEQELAKFYTIGSASASGLDLSQYDAHH